MTIATGRLEASLVSFALGELNPPDQSFVRLETTGISILGTINGPARLSVDSNASPAGPAVRMRSSARSIIEAVSEAGTTTCTAIMIAPTLACVTSQPEMDREQATDAIFVGWEITFRLADWLRGRSGSVWWDHALTAAGIGSVLALSRLWGLGADVTTAALGLSAAQAPTFDVVSSTSVRRTVAERISSGVVDASLAAKRGLGGPPDPLTGDRGLFAVLLGRTCDWTEIVEGLGTEWRLERMLEDGSGCPWRDCSCGGRRDR